MVFRNSLLMEFVGVEEMVESIHFLFILPTVLRQNFYSIMKEKESVSKTSNLLCTNLTPFLAILEKAIGLKKFHLRMAISFIRDIIGIILKTGIILLTKI